MMKVLSLLSVVLLAGSSLLAEPVPAPSSELTKLRQEYADSLNRLLQQHVKNNDVAAAAVVSRELDKMASAPAEIAPNMSPAGVWKWPGGGTITIASDGITTNTEWKTKGIWRWTDESKRQLQIEWQDGYLDTLTVSPDGTKLQGTNNADIKFVADRLPSPQQVLASAATK